ncbi:BLUF domain-containing protein [Spirosoma validum]|uniref:BLUF domain-containing protein n=1 Tax=Spirosoma validum TaxID=2771355 RepID=A0A927B4J8_9BACT|nr:BLUF domain-containing protein [Spirosoma validum]MBD2755248.1 BLUF domain-containing protein [Spirosoma validum]
MEHCIVYFSSSVGQFQEEDLDTILQQSRRNNARLGVTGMLLYVRGSIIQVLEGEKETIEALYKRIEHDERHTNVSIGINRPIAQRLFADWSMGYETITTRQLEEIKAIVDVDNRQESEVDSQEPIIFKTLKVFYQGNRYN